MGKVKQVFIDLEHEGPDQEPEASNLASFVALSVFIAMIACWCAIGSGSM